MMEWRRLLSRKRWDGTFFTEQDRHDEARTCFERDADRIVFSPEFRRLHDKTQVFPLSNHDVVHSRLTHSLEVACVGRSLGTLVGEKILKNHPELEGHYTKQDFGAIVYAACLAHDIGNPPFGHFGESSIRSFFSRKYRDREGWDDFRNYEGNAQSFRILCSTSMPRPGGMKLTAATLGAVLKYPRGYVDMPSSPTSERQSTKKNGVFKTEMSPLSALASEVGLVSHMDMGVPCWSRHPLSILVEAADDICYVVLDVEDGIRLKLIKEEENEEGKGVKSILARISKKSKDLKIEELRASAIDCLIRECASAFLEKEVGILQGEKDTDRNLIDFLPQYLSDGLNDLRGCAREKCYRSEDVMAIEMAGFRVLDGLLELFVRSAMQRDGVGPDKEILEKTRQFLEVKKVLTSDKNCTDYEQIMKVVSYIGGMTDRYAMAMYQRLTGISLPERGI